MINMTVQVLNKSNHDKIKEYPIYYYDYLRTIVSNLFMITILIKYFII